MLKIDYKLLTFISTICLLVWLIFLLRDMDNTLARAQDAINKIAHDRKVATDSLRVLNKVNDSLNQSITIYKDSLEALSKYKSKVIIKYRDQKNFVNDADIHQLDSVIRSNTTIGF